MGGGRTTMEGLVIFVVMLLLVGWLVHALSTSSAE
jgi:hypothetical protein